MSRKSFQLLVQGTIPPGESARYRELITAAVEKALLPLDRELIWVASQTFASFDPTKELPAFQLERKAEAVPSSRPTFEPSEPASSDTSPSASHSPESASLPSEAPTTP